MFCLFNLAKMLQPKNINQLITGFCLGLAGGSFTFVPANFRMQYTNPIDHHQSSSESSCGALCVGRHGRPAFHFEALDMTCKCGAKQRVPLRFDQLRDLSCPQGLDVVHSGLLIGGKPCTNGNKKWCLIIFFEGQMVKIYRAYKYDMSTNVSTVLEVCWSTLNRDTFCCKTEKLHRTGNIQLWQDASLGGSLVLFLLFSLTVNCYLSRGLPECRVAKSAAH